MTNALKFTKLIPWWGWIVVPVALLFVFGETKVSVGNVSVGGKDLGGFSYDSRSATE